MPLDLGIPELLVIFVIVLIVFGPGRIPELARGLGELVRDLRKTASELTRDFTAELGGPPDKPALSDAQVVCPHCSALNPVGYRYCGHCGAGIA